MIIDIKKLTKNKSMVMSKETTAKLVAQYVDTVLSEKKKWIDLENERKLIDEIK